MRERERGKASVCQVSWLYIASLYACLYDVLYGCISRHVLCVWVHVMFVGYMAVCSVMLVGSMSHMSCLLAVYRDMSVGYLPTCPCTHSQTHLYSLSHTHRHTHARTCTHAQKHRHRHTHTRARTHAHTQAHKHTQIYPRDIPKLISGALCKVIYTRT